MSRRMLGELTKALLDRLLLWLDDRGKSQGGVNTLFGADHRIPNGYPNPVRRSLEGWHKKGGRSLPASSNPLI